MILKVIYSVRVLKKECSGFLREIYYLQRTNEEKYEETLQKFTDLDSYRDSKAMVE